MTARNLALLESSASSARVLNLRRVERLHALDRDHIDKPFFRNSLLNRSIILKHRLRSNELHLFNDGRLTATKIIVPVETGDLSLGGWSVFIGQKKFEVALESMVGEIQYADRSMMTILDQLPSFDPFLLREHLTRHDRFPAQVYFEISEADIARMTVFVESEIQKLIDICYRDVAADAAQQGGSMRLVKKILSMTVDNDTEPLRLTLHLDPEDYQEGVFCWKGFLYYKWTLNETAPRLRKVLQAIGETQLPGLNSPDVKAQFEQGRKALRRSIRSACKTAQRSLEVYDSAFDNLVMGRPQAFREFLLGAPVMFTDLGERLGAVSHIVSFWNFRFPPHDAPAATVGELLDLFTDFAASLSTVDAVDVTPDCSGGTASAGPSAGRLNGQGGRTSRPSPIRPNAPSR